MSTESPAHRCNGVNGAAKHGTQNKCTVCGEYRNGWFDANGMEVRSPTTLPARQVLCVVCHGPMYFADDPRHEQEYEVRLYDGCCAISFEYVHARCWSRRTASVGADAVAANEEKYAESKRCCTVCDARKKCHVCGAITQYACSDCAIDFGATVYVCATKQCRDAHEIKCSAVLRARMSASPSDAAEICAEKENKSI